MNKLYVGIGKTDITPALGCLLYGYPRKRLAEGILDKLSIGAVALMQGKNAILLISADICGISKETSDNIRAAVAAATSVPAENIYFSTIHTHSGPITRTSAGWGTADQSYLDETLCAAAVTVAREAKQSAKSAVMGVQTVQSMIGINRREIKDGKVILGQNPNGPYDPTMTLIHFKSTEGAPIGSIVHIAVHPTVAGSNHNITRDWPGYLVDHVEKLTGTCCIYINGAEGDVGPRLSNGQTTATESYIPEIGLQAQKDVQRAYEAMKDFHVPEMRVHTEKVCLPFAQPPAQEIVDSLIKELGDPDRLVDVAVTKYAQLNRIKAMYESGEPFPEGAILEQTVTALGELALVPAPFEAFCGIALDIRRKSPYKNTLLLGLTNGSFGYLPTGEQLPYGGYEVDSFHAAGITGFQDDTDERFIAANIDLLHQLRRDSE